MRFHAAAFAVVLAASSVESFHVAPSRVAISSRSQATFSRPFGVVSQKQVPLTILSLAPGGGPEGLNEYIASQAEASKSTSKVKNPKLVKLAGAAALPLTYLVGAAITPTRYLAAKAVVGAVAAATGGAVGKSIVEEDVRKGCPAAVAQRLLELGVDGDNVGDGIEALKDDYGVDEADFNTIKIEVYAAYLVGMAKNPMTKMSELKELTSLREALRLNNQQVGQAHADAAVTLFEDILRFLSSKWDLEDPDHPDRMSLDKFLFLSERAYAQGGETDDAKTFEFSRVARAMGGLKLEEALERVRFVAIPFYERALKSTREKLQTGAVSAEMLERARDTLGISEQDAHNMHIEAFSSEVRAQLGLPADDDDDEIAPLDYDQNRRIGTDSEARELLEKMMNASQEAVEDKMKETPDTSDIKFKEGAFEHLSKLQEVLAISDRDAELEMQITTADYWRDTATRAFRDAVNNVITPKKCWDIIRARQDELLLKDSFMKELVLGIIMQTMGKPLEKVNAFARVNNAAATYDGLIDAIAAKEVCKEVCQMGGWEDFEKFEEFCFDPNDSKSACGFISRTERQNMYNIFFGRSLKFDEKGRRIIDDEALATLKILRGMLGISEEDAEFQMRNVFGPELNKILTEAVDEISEGNVTPTLLENMKKDVAEVITEFRLDEGMKQQSAIPLYDKAVGKIAASTPGGIPSKDEVKTLEIIRDFLGMPEDQIYVIHMRYFADAYRKAVKEALGSTGVIREEFRAPLEDLRNRLAVPEEAAEKMRLDAIGERMKPMVEYISEEMERTVLSADQLAKKRGMDYGEDYFKTGKGADGKLGLGTEGNIMGDIMNLVDFYVENDIVKKKQVGTKKVEKKVEENGEEKTVEDEVPVYENDYPITALGKNWIDAQNAELCYRQFLVSSFTEQGPNAARYDASKATFGGILGLTAKKMEEIGSSIGGMVYDNFVTQALSTKEALDQQDMMFLANMQAKLGITIEQGEQMLLNTQKKIMSEKASTIFDRKGNPPTPEELKAFREKCNSMGLDIETDVGLSRARVVNAFSMEISPGIESGEITMDSGDIIAEVQESLGLTEEEGEEVISNIITEQAVLLYSQVRSSMLRGLDIEALDAMKKLIQYARFVDGECGLEVEEKMANQAWSIFENSDSSDIDEETLNEQKRLLRIALGLPVNA